MARSVRIFSTKCWTKRINVRQSTGESFTLKLNTHCEVCTFTKEVFLSLSNLIVWQGRHAEHLTRAFAIASSDNGRMDIDEIALLEKLVHGVGHPTAHAEDRAIEVGTRS